MEDLTSASHTQYEYPICKFLAFYDFQLQERTAGWIRLKACIRFQRSKYTGNPESCFLSTRLLIPFLSLHFACNHLSSSATWLLPRSHLRGSELL